jgi:colicin import membrane protein
MKKYVIFLTVALLFIMLSACTSMAKNQQSPTLTSQIIEQPIILKEVIVAPAAEEPVAPEEDIATPAKKPFILKEVIIAPQTEKPQAAEEDIATPAKEPFVLKEVIVAPPIEESAASNEVEESAASSDVIGGEPVVTNENPAQESSNQSETESTPEENIRTLVNTWLTSWESGDFDSYRNCYVSDFRSKGMNLDSWIDNKIKVRKKSQNISISMGDMQISVEGNIATAKFYLHYISSILDNSGIKILDLKRTKSGWKIYKEIMQ